MSVTDETRPTFELGHRVAQRPEGVAEPETPVLQWYELHPIVAERPAEGEAGTPVDCGTCGETVDCLLASTALRDSRRVRRRRARYAYRAGQVLALVAAAGAFAYGAAKGTTMSGAGLALLVVVLVGGLWAASFANDLAKELAEPEDGLRLATPSAVHEIRPPGRDRDYDYHSGDSTLGGE
ncbi:hypothetical protein [Actinoplanes sp. L3-i22]|uniref:hypothetical protein n=1 Tax=Actinoplanes sp. L3-i22 TaxID=2836373 RepID=UPI001C78C4DF|nr:hypothetical protein [Actinoplanes sp. L3-i22]BCY08106.1 hypothetical protein L3i22_031940 [Actinoplanes sp. L3-i22]